MTRLAAVRASCKRGGVGDAGAVEVGRRLAGLLGQAADLMAGAVDQRDADAQAAQQGDVEQQIAEVLVLDDGAVQGDDEHPVAELRHVTQDLAQVGQSQHVHHSPGARFIRR